MVVLGSVTKILGKKEASSEAKRQIRTRPDYVVSMIDPSSFLTMPPSSCTAKKKEIFSDFFIFPHSYYQDSRCSQILPTRCT